MVTKTKKLRIIRSFFVLVISQYQLDVYLFYINILTNNSCKMKFNLLKLLIICLWSITIHSQTTTKRITLGNNIKASNKIYSKDTVKDAFVEKPNIYNETYLNALNFGIKNDGVKDQSELIQSLIDKQISNELSGGKVIFFPRGTYKIVKQIKLINGITIMGEGQSSTVFLCSGEHAGYSLFGKNLSIRSLTIATQSAYKNAIAVDVYGDNAKIQDVSIVGPFDRGVYIHADNNFENTYSSNTKIDDVTIRDIKSVAIEMEHCIDTYLSSISIYNKKNDTNAVSLLINTGTSGLYLNRVICGFGKHSLKVQHTLNKYGTNRFPGWKSAPIYLFLDQFIADTNTGGDAILFDTTLDNNIVSCVFNNSWAAYAGKMEDGTTFQPNACGLHIKGGTGINFNSGRIRLNSGNGVLISSEKVKYIKISNNFITSNNVANNFASGINVNAAASAIEINNNTIGNILDVGGNQSYGIFIAKNAFNISIIGNSFWQNNKGTIKNDSPFEVAIIGNLPNTNNLIQSGIKIANNPLNSGIQAFAFVLMPDSTKTINLIHGGLILLRNIDDGKSAVFLVESTGGTTLIAGDSTFIVGKPEKNNQIGLLATVSETSLHNSFNSKKTVAVSVFLVQGNL